MSEPVVKQKPFSMEYVLRLTVKYQREAIDRSIRMTSDRIAEFAGDQAKSLEILQTLSKLHNMSRNLDEFLNLNKDSFKG